jgi:hypothetical protein
MRTNNERTQRNPESLNISRVLRATSYGRYNAEEQYRWNSDTGEMLTARVDLASGSRPRDIVDVWTEAPC